MKTHLFTLGALFALLAVSTSAALLQQAKNDHLRNNNGNSLATSAKVVVEKQRQNLDLTTKMVVRKESLIVVARMLAKAGKTKSWVCWDCWAAGYCCPRHCPQNC